MISDNLKALRKIHHYSQEEVAEKLQVSRQAVAKWENGDTTPDIHNCAALAGLYDVTVDDLIHYDNKENASLPIPPKGKHMFGVVVVGEKGQIVIPKKARQVFDIKPGDNLLLFGDEQQGIGIMKEDVMLNMFNEMRRSSSRD